MANEHDQHGHHGGVEPPHVHVLPLSLYWGVFGLLLVLTVLTVAVTKIELGPFSLAVAMAIAVVKATLVLMIFMHLWYDHKLNLLMASTSFLFLSIFIVLTMFDTEGRDLVDPVKRNFLPRDEVVQKHKEKDPKAPELRPGCIFTECNDQSEQMKDLKKVEPHHAAAEGADHKEGHGAGKAAEKAPEGKANH